VGQIGGPIITLVIGIFLNKYFSNRERVIAYQSRVAVHKIKASDPKYSDTQVNTHSLVVRNTGTKSAINVRIGHNFLPDFHVFPDIPYEVNELPGGGSEIIFPTLVPKKEIDISYVYFPPDTFNLINTHVESDEGPAKIVTVQLFQVLPPWFITAYQGVALMGVITTIYLIVELVRWLFF